jgi:hypothetical protein
VLLDACQALGVRSNVSVEPGRSIVAGAAITVYTVGTVKHIPGVRTYVSVDGGMSDNPRPVLYGSGYEAFLPSRVLDPPRAQRRLVGKHCESGDVLIFDAGLPAGLRSAICSPPRSPAPTATAWPATTTSSPARRWCSSVTATPGWWCGARPTRTWCNATWSETRFEYSPSMDGDPDPGEVVWTWVPYEDDPSQGKDRPVVVIGRRTDRLVGVALTSKRHDDEAQLEVGTGPWDRERRPSYAKLDRVLALDPDQVRREGAVLAKARFDDLVMALRQLHGLVERPR